jgi:hypothetical protein
MWHVPVQIRHVRARARVHTAPENGFAALVIWGVAQVPNQTSTSHSPRRPGASPTHPSVSSSSSLPSKNQRCRRPTPSVTLSLCQVSTQPVIVIQRRNNATQATPVGPRPSPTRPALRSPGQCVRVYRRPCTRTYARLNCTVSVYSVQHQFCTHSERQCTYCVVRQPQPQFQCLRGFYLQAVRTRAFGCGPLLITAKGMFGYVLLKFNSHHINVFLNTWSTKCRLIACMSTQIMSNLRDESIKPN